MYWVVRRTIGLAAGNAVPATGTIGPATPSDAVTDGELIELCRWWIRLCRAYDHLSDHTTSGLRWVKLWQERSWLVSCLQGQDVIGQIRLLEGKCTQRVPEEPTSMLFSAMLFLQIWNRSGTPIGKFATILPVSFT